MSLQISTALIDAIRTHAQAAGDLECCGLLLGDRALGHVVTVLPAANVAAEPGHRFELDPAVLLGAHRAARGGGPAIIGHYHSHPHGIAEPSSVDAAMAHDDGDIWLILGRDGAIRAWRTIPSGPVHSRFEPVEITVPPQRDLAPAAAHRH